jgi:hypothetical protein
MRLLRLVCFTAVVFLTACTNSGSQKSKQEGTARIVFKTKFHTFDAIKQDDVVGITYPFTNVGDGPLIINEVRKGCGCTKVVFPKEAVAPGDSANIEVIFDSAGFSGRQYKSVEVFSNDPQGPVQLSFSTNVLTDY